MAGRKRILIVGCGGSGKSTFARALAEVTGLPLVHLDAHFWRPGWVKPPREEWDAQLKELLARERWIIDGSYERTLPVRLERADAVVFFDCDRVVCLANALQRILETGPGGRPDMATGCDEKLDFTFLRWIWAYSRTNRPRVLAMLESRGSGVRLITVRDRSDAEDLLVRQAAEHALSAT